MLQFIGSVVLLVTGAILADHAGKFGDNIADDNSYVTPRYDMYYDLINRIDVSLWYVPDMSITVLYGLTLVLHLFGVIKIAFTKLIFELGVLYIIRAIACRLTVGYSSPRSTVTYGKIKGGTNCYVSDLVISEHTMTASILFCTVFDVCNSNWLLALYGVIWFVSVSSNLFVGDHYSSDVFIGLVITYLLHY